jgi:hypothetical protein
MSDLTALVERLARDAGFLQLQGTTFPGNAMTPAVLERFAKLVADECCRINETCLEQGFLNPSSIIRSRFGLT